MINEFLSTLFSDLTEDQFIEVRALKASSHKSGEQFFTDSIEDAKTWIENKYKTQDVYVGVLPRFGSIKEITNRPPKVKRGTLDDIKGGNWLWADLDAHKIELNGKDILTYALERFGVPPNIVVSSGSGGIHLYWKIEYIDNNSKIKELNNILADRFGSDHVGDATRILRVPGTSNHKDLIPNPVELKHLDKTYTYSSSDLRAAANISTKFHTLISTGNLEKYSSRSERDYAVIGMLIKYGLSDEFIFHIYDTMPVGEKFHEENGSHYLNTTIEKLREKENKPEGQVTINVTSKWGIIKDNNCYYGVTPDGITKQLSTFIFEPNVLLEGKTDQEIDTFIGTIYTQDRKWDNISLSRKAFNSVEALTKELPKASWQWLGRDNDVKKLLPFLLDEMLIKYGKIITREATQIIGRYNDIYVFPTQVINKDGIVDVNKSDIAWLPSGKEYPQIEFKEGIVTSETIRYFLERLLQINTLPVVLCILAFYIASLYKTELEKIGVRLPILTLFGTRGSGKTTILTKIMQPLIGYSTSRTYDANTTQFVMLSLLGSSNCIPISFSEYRKSTLKDPDRLIRYILLAYDNGHDSRGKADQTTQDYPLSAPFTIDGEDAITDAACLERIIQLNLKPETIKENSDAYKAFQEIEFINKNAIGLELIKFTLNHQINYEQAMFEIRQIFENPLPDRVRRNFAVMLAGIKIFRQFCDAMGCPLQEFNYYEIFSPALENVVTVETGRTRLAADDFIEDVINEIEKNTGYNNFIYKYEPENNILYLHLKSSYNWWLGEKRKTGQGALEQASIARQLRERTIIEGLAPTPGNYVLGTESKRVGATTVHSYKISLRLARDSGLDIPYKISRYKPKIKSIVDEVIEIDRQLEEDGTNSS